jgi:hypothetical protein
VIRRDLMGCAMPTNSDVSKMIKSQCSSVIRDVYLRGFSSIEVRQRMASSTATIGQCNVLEVTAK